MKPAPKPTIGDCAAYARERLPRLEADVLACRALAVPRSHLYAFEERAVLPAASARVAAWVARRASGEPVAYILGRREFWGLDLELTPAALVPRHDTETLVEATLPHILPRARVLDMGTGCGAVALAIAAERPNAKVVATDIDARCAALCRRNAVRLGLQVETRSGDLFCGIAGVFDIVVSNPPYVDAADAHLRRGDLRHEPRLALVGGPNRGLDFIARLIRETPSRLRQGGWLGIEHGADQAASVRDLFAHHGFAAVRCHRDIEHRPRVTVGQVGGETP